MASKSGRKAEGNEDIRSLTKVSGGASYAITLPRAVIKSFKWKERQKLKLVVDTKKQTILIRDWKK
jgi:antitoxin component of MazEF toxin-antitoxin module